MDADERLITAIAERANERLYEEGLIYFTLGDLNELIAEQSCPEATARHVLRQLDDQGLLTSDDGHFFQSRDAGLAVLYQDRYDRRELWHRNELRREVLRLATLAFERDEDYISFSDGGETFTDQPYGEAVGAARILHYWGLVELEEAMGKNFWISITSAGYHLARDEASLRRELPTSAADDEEAHTAVAADALGELITSVEQMLKERGWDGALRELGRADAQYQAGHWTDAVGESYAALESGLKHRLDEAGVPYKQKAALRDLARAAVKAGLVPPNYQELFGFADSIRSPRRHGAGGRVEEVEIGPAEALLMSNHVRSLLLYLGHRP